MITQHQQKQIKQILLSLTGSILWKPNKEDAHLKKRIRQGHLPEDATLEEYRKVIVDLVSHPEAKMFAYKFGEQVYATAVADLKGRPWLVMTSLEGVMETCFIIDRDDYLDSYVPLGKLHDEE